jgi:predicted esterase
MDGGADAGAAACTTNGCVRRAAWLGDYSQAELEAWSMAGAVIENGYSVHRLALFTDGREALVTLTVPWNVSAPDGGWHLVLNNPGTVGVDDRCATSQSTSAAGLAGTFGARGLVGAALDYPGLGTEGIHPYLVARVEGRASLDAVRAALTFLYQQGHAVSGRAALVGLSQGGHAVLSAAAEHAQYAAELDIRAFAAAGPATLWAEHWAPGILYNGSHQVFIALLTWSWALHYGHDGGALWDDGMASRIDGIMTSRCTWDPSEPTLFDDLGMVPQDIFSDAYIAAFYHQAFQDYPVFSEGFAVNRIRPYAQTAPLRIYQGDLDDIVLEAATRQVVHALQDGGVDVDYVVVDGGHHVDVAFGWLAYPQVRTEDALSWLRARLLE